LHPSCGVQRRNSWKNELVNWLVYCSVEAMLGEVVEGREVCPAHLVLCVTLTLRDFLPILAHQKTSTSLNIQQKSCLTDYRLPLFSRLRILTRQSRSYNLFLTMDSASQHVQNNIILRVPTRKFRLSRSHHPYKRVLHIDYSPRKVCGLYLVFDHLLIITSR